MSNINEKLANIEDRIRILVGIEEQKKEKFLSKFFKIKEKLGKSIVPILYLKNSGKAELHYVAPSKGWYSFNDKIYKEEADSFWIYGKKNLPIVIIPEWSLKPIKRSELFALDKERGNLQEDVTYAISAIEHAEIVRMEEGKIKKPVNYKAIIIFGLIGIIAFAIIKGMGGGA